MSKLEEQKLPDKLPDSLLEREFEIEELKSRPEDTIVSQELTINIGPHHPSTHGVFRAIMDMDGEIITRIEPVIGHLHRCFEKIAENRSYAQFMPFTDRMDYTSAMLNGWAYAMAVEKLAGIQVPERAEYLRVIAGELNRAISHLMTYTFSGLEAGAVTPFFWWFEERDKLLDLFEEIAGARMTFNYARIGGVSGDAPDGWFDRVRDFIKTLRSNLDEYYKLLFGNYIFKKRMKGIGVISAEEAIRLGITGPCLRASGVNYDVRKADPYSIYPRFDFEVPISYKGDNYDRMYMRFLELQQSLRIVEQALDQIPDGPIMAEGVPRLVCPPPGEVYAHVESSRGALGYYIVSDGSPKPYRVKIQAPSFGNLQAFTSMVVNNYFADVIMIFGTFDPCFGEVDR
ncbi:MAG: NADH-quinone oxidoreductase subunit D [Actinobacteria bacterium]|nr:NADH-quinone oxidoreductase subunit D [Actinomycetota bacterium]